MDVSVIAVPKYLFGFMAGHSHSGLKQLSVKLTKTGSCTSEFLWVISSFLKDIKALLTYSDEKKPLRTCNNKDQSLE